MRVILTTIVCNNYHFLHISGALRRVPSPLHGTSHKTRSNWSWLISNSLTVGVSEPFAKFLSKRQLGKCCASWFVTIKLAVDILFVWWIRRLHLWTSTSFAMTYIKSYSKKNQDDVTKVQTVHMKTKKLHRHPWREERDKEGRRPFH